MMKRIIAILMVCAVFAMVGMQFVFAWPALNQPAMVLPQVSVVDSDRAVSQQNGGEDESGTEGESENEGEDDLEADFYENRPVWSMISAEMLGLDEDRLFRKQRAGESIAQVAEEKGIDVQAITDAIVAAETTHFNKFVSNGYMTQAEADEYLAELGENVAGFLNEGWEMCELEGSDKFKEAPDWRAITAQKLGVDKDALYKEGKTIAQLAEEKGVDPQSIMDEIIAKESQFLNELVSSGQMTQAEADEWSAKTLDFSSSFLNQACLHCDGPNWEAISAQALGMDEDALLAELDAGKSIAEIAKERGVDVQTIANALIAADTEYTNKLVADGHVTQAEADESLAGLTESVNWFLDESVPVFEECGEFIYGPDWFTISTEALSVDQDTLFTELDAGKTMAQIAQERGVDTQVIVDAITAKETEFLTQLVNDGEMTQAEADESLAELPTRINEFLTYPN